MVKLRIVPHEDVYTLCYLALLQMALKYGVIVNFLSIIISQGLLCQPIPPPEQ